MSELNTQTGGSSKTVTVTVTRNEYGDWKPEGDTPVNIEISSDGVVVISPKYTIPGTTATSVSSSVRKESNTAESETDITEKPKVVLSEEDLKLIKAEINPSDWENSFGDTPVPPGPTGDKEHDPDKPIVVKKPDGATIILPPKNPKIKTFVVRYVHWDGTAREYVVSRTTTGWETISQDGCRPITDASGTVVSINAGCGKTTPVGAGSTSIGGGGIGSGTGTAEKLVCQYNALTKRYELYDPVGDHNAAVDANGNAAVGEKPPEGMSIKEWHRSRIGFTGIPCSNEQKKEPPYKPKEPITISTSRTDVTIEVRTEYAIRDYSRVVEVNEDDNLIVRIPNDPNRPVIAATLTYTDVKGQVHAVEVGKRNERFTLISTPPTDVRFDAAQGIFTIKASSVEDNSEVKLDYRTLVRVNAEGGIIGVYKDNEGSWVEVTESTNVKMDKEALSFIDPKFNLLPPDIAVYKNHYMILPANDTGTVYLEVKVYNADDQLVIMGNSALAPNGIGWVVTGDVDGYLIGNTNNGNMTLQKRPFKGQTGKIIATAWDQTKTLSQATIYEIKTTDDQYETELPTGENHQQEVAFTELINGGVSFTVFDKDLTHGGSFSFVTPAMNEKVAFDFAKQEDGTFKITPVMGSNTSELMKQIKVNQSPHFKVTIPHWVIRDYTDVNVITKGDPAKSDTWVEMLTNVTSLPPEEVLTADVPILIYGVSAGTITVQPQNNTTMLKMHGKNNADKDIYFYAVDTSFGVGDERDWKLTNSNLVPFGYTDETGTISIEKDTGNVTIQRVNRILKKKTFFYAEARHLDPEGEASVASLELGKAPELVVDFTPYGTEIQFPDIEASLANPAVSAQNPEVKFTPKGIHCRPPKDGNIANLNKLRAQLQVDDNLYVDLHISKVEDQWRLETNRCYIDTLLTIDDAVKVDPETGEVLIDRGGIQLTHFNYNGLDYQDGSKWTGILVFFGTNESNQYFKVTADENGITYSGGQLVTKPLKESSFNQYDAVIGHKGVGYLGYQESYNGMLAPTLGSFVQHRSWSNSFLVPITRNFEEVLKNSNVIGFNGSGNNDNPFVRSELFSTGYEYVPDGLVKGQSWEVGNSSPGRAYFGASYTARSSGSQVPSLTDRLVNKIPTLGRLRFLTQATNMVNPVSNRTHKPRLPAYVNPFSYLTAETPSTKGTFHSGVMVNGSTGNKTYFWHDANVDIATPMFPEDMMKLDKVMVGVYDKYASLHLLSLSAVRERITMEEAPITFHIWTDDGTIPDSNWTATKIPGVRIPIDVTTLNKFIKKGTDDWTIERRYDHRNLGYLNQAAEGERYGDWRPYRLIELLKEKFITGKYLDEFVTNQPLITTKLRWVMDSNSSLEIDKLLRYSSARESGTHYSAWYGGRDERFLNKIDDVLVWDDKPEGVRQSNYVGFSSNYLNSYYGRYFTAVNRTDDVKETKASDGTWQPAVDPGQRYNYKYIRYQTELARLPDIELDGLTIHVAIGWTAPHPYGSTAHYYYYVNGRETFRVNNDGDVINDVTSFPFVEQLEDIWLNLPKLYEVNKPEGGFPYFDTSGIVGSKRSSKTNDYTRIVYLLRMKGGWSVNTVDYDTTESNGVNYTIIDKDFGDMVELDNSKY